MSKLNLKTARYASSCFKKAALIFDFDGTLVSGSMCEGLFDVYDLNEDMFWRSVDDCVNRGYGMEHAYLSTFISQLMLDHTVRLKDLTLVGAQNLNFFKGLPGALSELCDAFEELKIQVDVYCITSGFRDIVRYSVIGECLEYCWGSAISEDTYGYVTGVSNVVTAYDKAEIIEGLAEEYGVSHAICVDRSCAPRILYVGDGLTDKYAIEKVKDLGGEAILVFDPASGAAFKRASKVADELCGEVALLPADFSIGTQLNNSLVNILMNLSSRNGCHMSI